MNVFSRVGPINCFHTPETFLLLLYLHLLNFHSHCLTCNGLRCVAVLQQEVQSIWPAYVSKATSIYVYQTNCLINKGAGKCLADSRPRKNHPSFKRDAALRNLVCYIPCTMLSSTPTYQLTLGYGP